MGQNDKELFAPDKTEVVTVKNKRNWESSSNTENIGSPDFTKKKEKFLGILIERQSYLRVRCSEKALFS